MLITYQARQRLSTKLFGKVGVPCLLFDRWFISTMSVGKSFHAADDVCGESESFSKLFDDVSPVSNVEIL